MITKRFRGVHYIFVGLGFGLIVAALLGAV